MKIMMINGSLGGKTGNTFRLLEILSERLRMFEPAVAIDHRDLLNRASIEKSDLALQDAFVFASGTYWDSWGSPLQKFLEDSTPLEADPSWFGKPAAIAITMHSVGGKEVSSRLQGVLNSFGLFVPPMSSMTYSLVNQIALQSSSPVHEDAQQDLWCLEDLDILARNLLAAAQRQASNLSATSFVSWPVDRANPRRLWLETVST